MWCSKRSIKYERYRYISIYTQKNRKIIKECLSKCDKMNLKQYNNTYIFKLEQNVYWIKKQNRREWKNEFYLKDVQAFKEKHKAQRWIIFPKI